MLIYAQTTFFVTSFFNFDAKNIFQVGYCFAILYMHARVACGPSSKKYDNLCRQNEAQFKNTKTKILFHHTEIYCTVYTVRKMDPILRSIQRMLQTQLSMVRKFTLWQLRRYSVKHS